MESITVCIPTYNRPDLLRDALSSLPPKPPFHLKIAIGDDSPGDETEIMVRGLNDPRITYHHHRPSLGQKDNVQFLFQRVDTPFLCLLHDDDCFVEGGLEALCRVLLQNPEAEVAFGNQLLADVNLKVNPRASRRLNAAYGRVPKRAGWIREPLIAGIEAMFPNDGWVARTDVVRQCDYSAGPRLACDYAFGLELMSHAKFVYYLPEPVAIYRETAVSVLRGGGNAGAEAYEYLVKRFAIPPREAALRRAVLAARGNLLPFILARLRQEDKHPEALKTLLGYLKERPTDLPRVLKEFVKLAMYRP